jgi:uncharacterized protein (DUF1810 family)
VNRAEVRSVQEIFGYPDHLKFRSSMTLFASAASAADSAPFREALAKHYAGEEDRLTRELLKLD